MGFGQFERMYYDFSSCLFGCYTILIKVMFSQQLGEQFDNRLLMASMHPSEPNIALFFVTYMHCVKYITCYVWLTLVFTDPLPGWKMSYILEDGQDIFV